MGKQPLADANVAETCGPYHGEENAHLFITGVGTIDVQPAHHLEIAILSEIAHRFDSVVVVITCGKMLDVDNVVLVIAGNLAAWLSDLGLPHLLPSDLVILDRSTSAEQSAPLDVRVSPLSIPT